MGQENVVCYTIRVQIVGLIYQPLSSYLLFGHMYFQEYWRNPGFQFEKME